MSIRPSGVGAGVAVGATLLLAFAVVYSVAAGWWDYLPLAVVALAFGVPVSLMSWSTYRNRVKQWKQEQQRTKRLQDLWGSR